MAPKFIYLPCCGAIILCLLVASSRFQQPGSCTRSSFGRLLWIWKRFVEVYGNSGDSQGWSPYIPLWRNPKFPELLSLPGFEFGPQKGVKYLMQLYDQGSFRSFEDLRIALDLPHSALYCYFQLCHACSTQLGNKGAQLECGSLESVARRLDL